MGDYLIHDIRSRFDYRKHYLTPLTPNSPQPLLPLQTTAALEARNAARRRRGDRERRRRHEELDERDKLELSIAFRRWIYKHDLYAKVCVVQSMIFQPFDSRGYQA
jgi:E3 ubiquitin-protein ligase Topors